MGRGVLAGLGEFSSGGESHWNVSVKEKGKKGKKPKFRMFENSESPRGSGVGIHPAQPGASLALGHAPTIVPFTADGSTDLQTACETGCQRLKVIQGDGREKRESRRCRHSAIRGGRHRVSAGRTAAWHARGARCASPGLGAAPRAEFRGSSYFARVRRNKVAANASRVGDESLEYKGRADPGFTLAARLHDIRNKTA